MHKEENILSRNNYQISSSNDKTANDLIPELILKINKYSSKLKERVKLYSIFREFDSYAHMNLQNFIKLSDKRYRSIKSGNTLNNVLINQKKTYNELSNKILTNNLYNDKNIEKEEENLCKKTNNKDIKELYQIRRDIINKTKDLSKKELKRREKYLILVNNSRNQRINNINQIESQNKNINNNKNIIKNKTAYDSFRKKKLISKSLNMNFNSNFSIKNLNNFDINIKSIDNSLLNNDIKSKTFNMNKFYKEKDVLKSKKDFFDNLVKKDNKNINDYIIDYKLFLNKVKNTNSDNWTRIFNSKNNYGRTFSLNLDDIKLLSYQEEQEEEKTFRKKEAHEVDMKTLIKYTKRGNRKWFLNNIKEISKKRQNSFRERITHKKHLYNKIYKRSKLNTANIRKSQSDNNFFDNEKEKSIDNSNNNINNSNSNDIIDNMEKTNYTTFSNFRNTLKTVRNEANNIRKIEQNFDMKRRTMSEFFSRMNLPEIKEYEQELSKTRNNFNMLNNNNLDKIGNKTYYVQSSRKLNAKKINNKNSLKIAHNSSKKNVKNNKFISPKIFSDLLHTYNDKKKIWQNEDLIKENIKKEKLSHIAKTKKYLEEMSKFKRKPNLYIDPYSKRDGLVNNRIKLLTRSLSLPIYNQKKFQNRIDEFNNFIEQKEREIISNNKIMAETLKKEKTKLEEKDVQIQTKQKMKKNLEKEAKNKNQEDDIKFDYKFIPTLKATKKKNKNKSYKDYQEFFEIVKNKQKNGEYDINNIKDEIKE